MAKGIYKKNEVHIRGFLERGIKTRFQKGNNHYRGERPKGEKAFNWRGGISKDPLHVAERQRKYREANKEWIREKYKEYIRKNYAKKLLRNNQRRVLKIGNGGNHTIEQWEEIKAQFRWTCPSCKVSEPEISLTRDHIVPLSKGGTDNIDNIQPLCRSCNTRKHNKIIRYE